MILRLFAIILLGLVGCTRDPVQKEIARVESEGWKYYETVGVVVKGAEFMTYLHSRTGKELHVMVVSEGKEVRKTYPQIDDLYYASVFMEPQLGSYALIFTKKK